MATATDTYAESVTGSTTEYLDSVRSCTALLPATLLRYGDPAFETTANRLGERETRCDDHLRELRRVLGDADPNYTDVYLRTGEVMELYALLDEVPNAAEQFVRDVDAVRPTFAEATRDDLADMAALASRATWLLCDAIESYVEHLVTPGDGTDVVDAVDQVGALESRADDYKYAILQRSFDGLDSADAMVVRDLVQSLDGTLDAAEDAADHLLFVASGQ